MAPFCQPFYDGVVGFYTLFVTACIELCLEDGVGIAVLCNYDVLVAAL